MTGDRTQKQEGTDNLQTRLQNTIPIEDLRGIFREERRQPDPNDRERLEESDLPQQRVEGLAAVRIRIPHWQAMASQAADLEMVKRERPKEIIVSVGGLAAEHGPKQNG
jgi:hypothetical protein